MKHTKHVGGERCARNMLGSVERTRITRRDACERSERYKHQTAKKKGEMHCKKNASKN